MCRVAQDGLPSALTVWRTHAKLCPNAIAEDGSGGVERRVDINSTPAIAYRGSEGPGPGPDEANANTCHPAVRRVADLPL